MAICLDIGNALYDASNACLNTLIDLMISRIICQLQHWGKIHTLFTHIHYVPMSICDSLWKKEQSVKQRILYKSQKQTIISKVRWPWQCTANPSAHEFQQSPCFSQAASLSSILLNLSVFPLLLFWDTGLTLNQCLLVHIIELSKKYLKSRSWSQFTTFHLRRLINVTSVSSLWIHSESFKHDYSTV